MQPRTLNAITAQIARAVREKKLVTFTYRVLPRVAQPVALGSTKGMIQVLALQIGGRTSNGMLPHWRRFLLQDIHDLHVGAETFRLADRPNITGFDTVIAAYDVNVKT